MLLEALLSGDDRVCTGSTWDASCWLHLSRDRAGVGVESSTAPPALKERSWKDQRKAACVLLEETPLFTVKPENKRAGRNGVFNLLGSSAAPHLEGEAVVDGRGVDLEPSRLGIQRFHFASAY